MIVEYLPPIFGSNHNARLPIWLHPSVALSMLAAIRAWKVSLLVLASSIFAVCSTVTFANLWQIGVAALPCYELLATTTGVMAVAKEAHGEWVIRTGLGNLVGSSHVVLRVGESVGGCCVAVVDLPVGTCWDSRCDRK